MADVEVLVRWGTSVLHVGSTRGRKGVSFGDLPIVTKSGALVLHPRATGWVRAPGAGEVAVEDLVGRGMTHLPFPSGVAHMELDEVAFDVTAHDAVEAPPRTAISDATTFVANALSLLLHVGLLASLAFYMPTLRDDDDGLQRDRMLVLRRLSIASAEREPVQPTPLDDDMLDDTGKTEGGTGAAAKGRAGAMGNPSAARANAKLGIAGPAEDRDPHTARRAALREAAEFGMIGLISATSGVDSPTTEWGRTTSLGNEPTSARGNMWGDAIGDSFGAAGLSLSGTGEGCGCGSGQGIGLGAIGTIGHGLGTGIGGGVGAGHGHLDGGHTPGPPFIRSGSTTVSGRLPAEVIQRVVRANSGRYKFCYSEGLRTNPSLEGRVVVKFVIARDGSVETSADGGSDLSDSSVNACVVRSFANLSFPEPEGGIVTVVYPLLFSPGG